MKARPPTWQEVRDDEPIYSPEQGDGRKSDCWRWVLFGWPATIALAGLLAWGICKWPH